MSKRVPVYLSESELSILLLLLSRAEKNYPPSGISERLKERLGAELATFEE